MAPSPSFLAHTLHCASFNNEDAMELLLELSRIAPSSRLALRALDMVQQLEQDSRTFREISGAINSEGLKLCHVAPEHRCNTPSD